MECACYFGKTMFELFDPDADVRIEMGTSLPHWYQPGVSYFVTFRTEDSMPVEVSRRWHAQRADWLQRHGISMGNRNWREQLDRLDVALRGEFHETFSRQYLETLDKGYGSVRAAASGTEQDRRRCSAALRWSRYHMGDFVVMPNHVHADCLPVGRDGNRSSMHVLEAIHGEADQSGVEGHKAAFGRRRASTI